METVASYPRDVRRPTAVAAVLLGTAWTLLAATMGWSWYVEGPSVIVVTAAAGLVAGAWLGPRLAALAIALLTVAAVVMSQRFDAAAHHWLEDMVFFGVAAGGPAIAGAAVATRARQVRRLQRLERDLAVQRELEAQAAALEERLRIRSTVHEDMAERVAAVALLAEAARRRGDEGVMAALETEARTVLDQLRQVIEVLRDRPTERPVAGHPSIPRGDPGVAGTAPSSGEFVPDTRSSRLPPRLLDIAVPAGLAVAMTVEIAFLTQARGPLWANTLAAAAMAAPLMVRRSRPLLAVSATTALAVLMGLWLTPPSELVTGVALVVAVFYAVGAWVPGRAWLLAWVVAAAGLVLLEWVAVGRDGLSEESDVWVVLLWCAVAVGLGRLAAGWQTRLQRIRSVVEELDRRRAVGIRLAAAREREAAASRLHDTVAHAMSVVCLHAGAQQRGATDAYSALSLIVAVAEESLAELREEVDASSASPLDPSLLTAIGRRLGVDVAVDVDLAVTVLGPHGGLAHRVIRESLVNITRHAPGARAAVSVGVREGGLHVEVNDEGPPLGRPADPPGCGPRGVATLTHRGTGTGLSGLREAVRAVGGSLEWCGRDGGGFHVVAVLPVQPQ